MEPSGPPTSLLNHASGRTSILLWKHGTCLGLAHGFRAPWGWAQSERKDERRRRGDEKTQTSDARFDERFQLGHGLGRGNQPWYAQQGSTLPSQEDRCAAAGRAS